MGKKKKKNRKHISFFSRRKDSTTEVITPALDEVTTDSPAAVIESTQKNFDYSKANDAQKEAMPPQPKPKQMRLFDEN